MVAEIRSEAESRPARARAGGFPSPLRMVLRVAAVLTALGAVAILSAVWLVRGSLPRAEGEVALDGLTAAVVVERDALGVPTIRASDRNDLAMATGFVHAQERFFQMDMLRRRAAGELSEVLGAPAAAWDAAIRVHRFRRRSRLALETATEAERAMLEAYASGVNHGIDVLGVRPFEYLVLRSKPTPWLPEDVMLVLFAMYIELQDTDGSRESDLGLMHDLLPGPLYRFLTAQGTEEWDAPLLGPTLGVPPVPGPEVFGLGQTVAHPAAANRPISDELPHAGSNSWAVGGRWTVHGGGMLANDMHLPLGVPNIWYRASFVLGADEQRRVTGVTLPGAPAMVVGSTGYVAWGFTNTYGDWSDLVVLEPDPDDPDVYLTPDGPRRIVRHEERIRIRGDEDRVVEVESTIWGPVIDRDYLGRRRVLRWTAHEPEAINFRLVALETARTVEEAIRIANESGIPAQNLVAADSAGSVGWTITGMIPRRSGFDGRLPGSWADGTRRWVGWLKPGDYPRVVDPPSGRIWTANNRTVCGEMLRSVGDGGYALGARARQIRDRLLELDRAEEADMLALQLDDRALLLERWRDLLLDLLTPDAVTSDPRRREVRDLVRNDWTGRASVDSAGYRWVRAFRKVVSKHVLDSMTAPCRSADPRFDPFLPQFEGPLWALVTERPPHLLDPRFGSWNERLLAAVDETVALLASDDESLREKTWGRRNTVLVRHALSPALPFLSRWLDMRPRPLPGDSHMPRFQLVSDGASQRMVVSPGREEKAIFHMPAGQSGHPLSPHYRDGHGAWEEGAPTPFLPGPPVAALRLVPR